MNRLARLQVYLRPMGPCLSSFFEVFCIRVAEAQRFVFWWLIGTGRATVLYSFESP